MLTVIGKFSKAVFFETMNLQLNLLSYQDQLQFSQQENKTFLYDPIRKKNLVLTPEEMVRQSFIQYLILEKNYNVNRINVEKQLLVNGLKKRFDIIVYDMNMKPFLLVECKAPKVAVAQATFDQVAQYNLVLKVDYLVVSNGIQSYCTKMDYENQTFQFQNHIPNFPNS